MLMIVGTINIQPDQLATALPAMLEMVTASRGEAGCVTYSYSQDLFEAGKVHVVEQWRCQAELDAHFRSGHIATWRKAWPALGITDRALTLYDVSNPRPT